MANVASLWYGSDVKRLGYLTMVSYLKHGHTFTLYTYDKTIKVPEGIILKDANEILDKSFIFGKNGKWQPFSDMFRYKMLMETDYIWVDMDAICLRPDWHFGEYVYGIQDPTDHEGMINNAILKLPKNGEELKYLYHESINADKENMVWESTTLVPYALGPVLLTECLRKFKIDNLAQNPHIFYPISPREFYWYSSPDFYNLVKEWTKESYVVHIYDSVYNSQTFNHIDMFKENGFLWNLEKEILGYNNNSEKNFDYWLKNNDGFSL